MTDNRDLAHHISMDTFKELICYWYIFENCTLEETHDLLSIKVNQEIFQHNMEEGITHSTLSYYRQYHEIKLHTLGLDSRTNQAVLPSRRTLERKLHSWKFQKNERLGIDDSQLVQRLWVLFYDMGLNDKEIIGFLGREGYTLSLRM